jgi:hypothetical protein
VGFRIRSVVCATPAAAPSLRHLRGLTAALAHAALLPVTPIVICMPHPDLILFHTINSSSRHLFLQMKSTG